MNLSADAATAAVNYSFVFGFESRFDYPEARRWFDARWHHCAYFSLAYLAVVFGLRRRMRSRPPLELGAALCAWSGLLAAFSALGAARVLPELAHVLRHHGFAHSVCDAGSVQLDRVSGFWSWAFAVSKLPELADTLFIVLRKRPLIFLHWYHHVATLSYVWYSYADQVSTGRWFVILNYCVHAAMYAYYALRAARVPVPRPVAVAITSTQLAQMLAGIGVNLTACWLKSRGEPCAVSADNIVISLSLYLSFFVLFAHFFLDAYVRRKSRQLPAAESDGRRPKGKAVSPDHLQ